MSPKRNGDMVKKRKTRHIRTMKEWREEAERTGRNETLWFDDFAKVGDMVSDEIVCYLMDATQSTYFREKCAQAGEPSGRRDGEDVYITFAKVEGKIWVYCGYCHKRKW